MLPDPVIEFKAQVEAGLSEQNAALFAEASQLHEELARREVLELLAPTADAPASARTGARAPGPSPLAADCGPSPPAHAPRPGAPRRRSTAGQVDEQVVNEVGPPPYLE